MAPMTVVERRAQHAERLVMIRLRMAIGRALDERGITARAEIAAALDLPEHEVISLLIRKRQREGDLMRLQAAADRLGLSLD